MPLRDEPRAHMPEKACDTPVPGMRNGAAMVPRSGHRLEQRARPQAPCVPQTPHTMLHVCADFGAACPPWAAQEGLPGLGEGAAITPALPPQACGPFRARLTVSDVARRHAPGQEGALVMDDLRPWEAGAPAQRGLPSRGLALTASVRGQAMLVTHRQRRRVQAG